MVRHTARIVRFTGLFLGGLSTRASLIPVVGRRGPVAAALASPAPPGSARG